MATDGLVLEKSAPIVLAKYALLSTSFIGNYYINSKQHYERASHFEKKYSVV